MNRHLVTSFEPGGCGRVGSARAVGRGTGGDTQPDPPGGAVVNQSARIRLRYFAAMRQAVGCSDEELVVDGGLDHVLAVLSERGEAIANLAGHCSYLVNGRRAEPGAEPLRDGDIVDVLPPFAGG